MRAISRTGVRRSAGWAGLAMGLGFGAGRAVRGLAGVAGISPKKSFRGEVVVVTGGSRGLGLILARLFAAEGARVAICARDERELARVREEFRRYGRELYAARCDVSDREEVAGFMRGVVKRFGHVDILVNNAGIMVVGPVQAMSHEDFEHLMDVNFWGTLNTILEVLPSFLRQRRGRIVNITSIGGVVSVPHLLAYACSKFAAVGLSEGLGAELRQRGIRVTTVVPGLMRTGSFLNALFKGNRASEVDWFSLSGNLPGVSMDAERAGRRILEACRRGDPYLTVGAPASLIRIVHALAPATTSRLMSFANLLLPSQASERDHEAAAEPGWKHREGVAASRLTALGDRAAERFYEKKAAS